MMPDNQEASQEMGSASAALQGAAVPGPSAGLLLLDLPTELLEQGLRDAPHSLRSTCHVFCNVLDSSCTTLRLATPAGGPRRLKDLTSLLRRLPQLRTLDNNHHDFKTLPFLAGCPTLQSLTLSRCTFTTHQLRALAACPELTSLNLSDCRRLLHLDFLSPLSALRSLNLTNCESLTSLAPLEHCTHLRSLTLSRCRGGWLDLSPLTALPSLEHLLETHNIETSPPQPLDLTWLGPCATALRALRVCNLSHPITSLAPLAACHHLQRLDILCCDAVTSLAPLAGCAPSLEQLVFRGLELATLAPLAAFTALQDLQLLITPRVTDLSPLAACTALTKLLVLRCDVADLNPLGALGPTLRSLALMCCLQVADITPLALCTALTHLDLSHTPVESYLPLVVCTRLGLLHRLVGPLGGQVPPGERAALLAACPHLVIQDD